MSINCIIVDDEPAAIRVVENFLKNLPEVNLAGTCKSAFEAIKLLKEKNIDLIFLDINMPGLSGIDFLKSLRNPPLVVVTTAYREYAVESYELDVIDYLHKPFSFDRFYQAFQKAEEKILLRSKKPEIDTSETTVENKGYTFFNVNKRLVKVNFNELLYIESTGEYCKINTTGERYIVHITLKKLLTILPPNAFIRVHKSFIVAIDKIKLVEGNMVKIGDKSIPIGYSYKKVFLDTIAGDN